MPLRQTRRELLISSGTLLTAAVLGGRQRAAAAVPARIEETRVITNPQKYYCGWPTLARRKNGQLLLVYSGGREAHVCPFGRVELMRSDDDGHTWSRPRVLMDGPIDDRDAGVLETKSGSILVTTFTSLAYEPILQKAESRDPEDPQAWSEKRLARWRTAHQRSSEEQRQQELGVWMIRSTNGGATWSKRYDCLVDSPHGPIQLSDGRLLYAGKELWTEKRRVGVCESTDDGQTWRWLAEIPARPGDRSVDYHELHAVETADGRIVVHVRNHNEANERETLQTESSDGGATWSLPRPIGVWGLPSHLLRLRDNRLLMSYGHRRSPLGNQARLSTDHGRTWSDPIMISADGTSGDLGYPSTVELADGTLLTLWYELLQDSQHAVLRQSRWSLGS